MSSLVIIYLARFAADAADDRDGDGGCFAAKHIGLHANAVNGAKNAANSKES